MPLELPYVNFVLFGLVHLVNSKCVYMYMYMYMYLYMYINIDI